MDPIERSITIISVFIAYSLLPKPILCPQTFLYDDNENCSICYEGMKCNHCVQCDKCENVFHQKYIEPWIKDGKNCPLCRNQIQTDSPKKE